MFDVVICTQNVETSSEKYMNLIYSIINWLLCVHGDAYDFAIAKAAMIITMYLYNGNSHIKMDKMLYIHTLTVVHKYAELQFQSHYRHPYSQPIINLSDKLIKPNIVSNLNYNFRFNNQLHKTDKSSSQVCNMTL